MTEINFIKKREEIHQDITEKKHLDPTFKTFLQNVRKQLIEKATQVNNIKRKSK